MVAITERFGMGSSTPEWMIKLNPLHRVRFPVARLRHGIKSQCRAPNVSVLGSRSGFARWAGIVLTSEAAISHRRSHTLGLPRADLQGRLANWHRIRATGIRG